MQLDFHMLAGDEALLLDHLDKHDLLLVSSGAPDGEPVVLRTFPEPESDRWWTSLWIVPADRLSTIVVETAAGDAHTLTRCGPPYIQMQRCFMNRGGLERGAFLGETRIAARSPGGGNVVYLGRCPAFQQAWSRLARWVRSNFTRDTHMRSFIGPDALRWRQGGGVLLW